LLTGKKRVTGKRIPLKSTSWGKEKDLGSRESGRNKLSKLHRKKEGKHDLKKGEKGRKHTGCTSSQEQIRKGSGNQVVQEGTIPSS